MTSPLLSVGLDKIPTGINGFDEITEGGLPKGRCTLVSGTAGSGKTLLALQFLAEGAKRGQGGVLVTFEETPEDLLLNARSLGFGLDEHVAAGRIGIVDVSPSPGEVAVETGDYDLSALLARIEHAARKANASRVIVDAVGSIFTHLADGGVIRRELHRIITGLRLLGVTTVMTVERPSDDGPVSRNGVEEFVADNVVVLRNTLEHERRRRTIEILKLRGGTHQKGEFPFTIDPIEGITIVPLSAIELTQESSTARIPSGNEVLDALCGGGMFQDSIVLVSGPTGTGKTLMVTQFVRAAIERRERALLFAFEESRGQLFRNADAWGVDFAAAERAGYLKVICRYPERMGLEDHLIHIRRDIEAFAPARVAVDSISAMERIASDRTFREFAVGVMSHVKHKEIAGMFTSTAATILGGESITETHIATITDSIILLRYVELIGQMRRGLTVLKMRGSWHDKDIREFTIDGAGMHIRAPFRNVGGILRGEPVHADMDERERLTEMFPRAPHEAP
jgi:circadian clock protein KaiC